MSDAQIMVIVDVAFFGFMTLYGLAIAAIGRAQARNPQGRLSWGKATRARQLHQWLPTLSWTRPEQQVDLFNQVTRLDGYRFLGAGLGLASGAVVLCGATLAYMAWLGANLSVTSFPFAFIAGSAPVLLLPGALGAALAFHRAAARAIPPAEAPVAWEGRRASDYVAPWVNWALTALGVLLAALCAGLAFTLPAIAGANAPLAVVAARRAELAAVAVITLLCPLVWRLAVRWIVTAPRALTFPYSGVASDAEDFLRGQVVSYTVPMTLFICGWLVLFQSDFLDLGIASISGWRGDLPFILIVAGGVALAAAVAAGMCRGRLGGARVGWPWSPRRPGLAAAPAAPLAPTQP